MYHLLASCVLYISISACGAIKNITWNVSSLELPVPLYDHISAVYDGKLHIVGGYTVNSSNKITPSYLTYSSASIALNHSFETHTFHSRTIACNVDVPQCYVAINENLYILQSNASDYHLIVYNMRNYSFTLASQHHHVTPMPAAWGSIWTGCPSSNGEWIWWLPPSVDMDYHISFNIKHNNWTLLNWESLSIARVSVGCSYYKRYIYVFGGRINNYFSGSAQYLEKCKMLTDQNVALGIPECSIMPGSTRYDRTRFHVQPHVSSYGAYVLLFGAHYRDVDALHCLEIFDLDSEQIVTTQYAMNAFNFHQFSSVIMNDTLFITGGRLSRHKSKDTLGAMPQKSIVFTNIPQMLTNDHVAFNDFKCVSRFQKTNYLLTQYLYQNQDQQLVLEVYNNDNTSADVDSYWIDLRITFFGVAYEVWILKDFEQNVFVIHHDRPDFDQNVFDGIIDIDIISELTNIDMTSHRSAFWMKWSALYDETGRAISSPIFRMGFGDIFDEFRFADFVTNHVEHYTLEVTDILQILLTCGPPNGLYFPRSGRMYWNYYHNLCLAVIEPFIGDTLVNSNGSTQIKIGDTLDIRWGMEYASSLNAPIYIKSNDIVGIDYALHVLDHSTCLLCKQEVCAIYSESAKMNISDLYSYDIDRNHYEVYLSSDVEIQITGGNPIWLTRSVMDVEIWMNETHRIYPHSEIYITAMYQRNDITQHNATVTVIWDDALSFDTWQCHMLIDFDANTCFIKYDNHTIDCKEPIIIPNTMELKPVHSNKYNIWVESRDVHILPSNEFPFYRLVQTISMYLNDTYTLSLGDVFLFKFEVLDSQIYQPTSSLIIWNDVYDIASIINIDHHSDQCFIVTPITGSKVLCDEGVEMKISNRSVIGHYIHLKIESDDTYLDEHNKSVLTVPILIDDCALGQGLVGTPLSSYSCSDCPYGNVGLTRDSQCIPCHDISGIECRGKFELIVTYNHWIAIAVHDAPYTLPIFEDYSASIISNFCPSGYCCQNIEKGCNYLQNKSQLCAPYRDPNTPLCGQCIEGYSEVYGSTACKKCSGDHYSALMIVFIVAFLGVFGWMFMDRPPSLNQEEENDINYLKLVAKDDFRSLTACAIRPMLYFFQGITFISFQTGFWFYLTPLMNILSLDLFAIQGDKEEFGICFIEGLQSIDKELWYLFFPGSMFISLALLAWITKNISKLSFRPISWQDFWSIFIIFIGNMVTTILRLLACAEIGSVYVHFYGAYHECFGAVWFFALLFFGVVIVSWIYVWFKLYRMSATQRESRFSPLRTMSKHYKPTFWYWESVLMSRRIFLAFMVTIEYVSYDVTQYMLLAVLVFYLVWHCRYYPFLYTRVNNMETICMLMLVLCLATVIFDFDDKYPDVVSVMMSFFVLVPIILFIIYLCLALKHFLRVGRQRDAHGTWVSNKIQNIQNRQPNLIRIESDEYDQENEDVDRDDEDFDENTLNDDNLNTTNASTETKTEMITLNNEKEHEDQ
eukprot:551888_1